MTSPLLAHQTTLGRMYSRSVSEPPRVPSITTVIAQQAIDLGGWHGHMAATELSQRPELESALRNPQQLRRLVRESSSAAERYRDAAAERGDRIHDYCEQVAREAMGMEHTRAESRERLKEYSESSYAEQFDAWWKRFQVQPLAAEVTVWNEEVGYAGTLDLVAKIGGRLCLIDYKTKGTDRNGRVKALDPKVLMQLAAGMKAQESLVDPQSGTWEPWAYGENPLLMGVALGETEAVAFHANPEALPAYWHQFYALRRLWQTQKNAQEHRQPLTPLSPPAGAS